MNDLLKNISLDYWYKLMIVIGLFFLTISLTVPVQMISNAALALMALGTMLVGIGEWVNHPFQSAINLGLGIEINHHNRRNHPGGVVTVIVGLVVFIAGAVVAFMSLR